MKKIAFILVLEILCLQQIASAQNINMGNLGTVTTACGGNFYDSGGPAGNYGNNEFFTATFCAPPGQYISFNFTSFNTEFLFDNLDVYNGPNTAAPLIGSYSGTTGPGTIISSLGGCITFVFESDNSVFLSGWAATITCSSAPPSTGNDCGTASPFCTGTSYVFPNNTDQPDLGPIDCLFSSPNPVWYYMQIANPGNLNINISQSDAFGFGIDVDFDLWGPFTTLNNGCLALANGTAPSIDCSYSPAFTEQANIVGATAGQFYILLLTNFSNQPGTISFSSGGGSTATTNCGLLCNITDITATPTACVPATGTYTLTGQVVVANPPTSGTMQVTTSCGGSVTLNAPFVSPINYSIPGIVATGGNCNVTATFSADPGCAFTQSYTSPISCASTLLNCPVYASSSSSPINACAGQVYYFDVANTACNGTISFNVVGTYGSPFGDEITWNVVSNLTNTIVAAGGPGIFGVNTPINFSVGPLNPATYGTIFTLNVFDIYGDGFDPNGTISIVQNGVTIGGPISGPGNWFNSSTIFGANIAISPATITINTPTGPVSSTVTGCNNFHVPLTLQNANFCNTININLPFTITCQSTGAIISSGTKNVTVYPSIPTSAADLVSIDFNPTTCTWSMTPQNDCVAANIGSIFTVSPNPATLSAPACTGGNETFTVAYNGILGGPNCCSTGGPQVPIVYNQSFAQTNVIAASSPFGGINNAALLTIPPNAVGGNATSLNFTLNINNYCYQNANLNSYWVTIIVDGSIVSDVWYNPALVNNTINLNLAAIPNGYNQNSTIQVYIYPNAFSATVPPPFTTFLPNGICGSLANFRWTAQISSTINASFADQAPTPAICTFSPFLPFSCCSSNLVPDGATTICSGAALTPLITWQSAVAAGNTSCIVYSSVMPVAGTVLPNNTLPNGINLTASPITQTVSAYTYCDADGSATINVGDTYTLVSTFALTINPLPTASIAGTASICGGTGTTITFTGTPNAIITYTINGGVNQTILLNGAGSATLATGNLAINTTYALVSVSLPGPPICSQSAIGNAVVTILTPPIATFTYPTPICNNGTNPFPTFTGGGVAGVFSSTPVGLNFVNTSTGEINLATTPAGPYTITNTIAAAGGCPQVTATFSIVINAAPNAGSDVNITLCSTGAAVNLFASLLGAPQSTGTWSGPSVLGGGNLGTFTPGTSTAGVYTYTVTGVAPCVNATATVTVTVNPAANAGSNGSITLCSSGAAVNLFASLGGAPQSTGTWSGPSVLGGGNLGTFTPGTSAAGVYTYTVIGVAPCVNATATVTVTVNPAPNAGSNGIITLCSTGAAVNLFASLGGTPQSTGTWSGPSVLGGSNLGTFTPGTSAAGVYTYTVTAVAPCVNATATVTVNYSVLVIPNFNPIPSYCVGDVPAILPNTSLNGIIGVWSPLTISTATSGTTVYTFTPDAGQCANPLNMNVTINNFPLITPIYHD